MNFHSQASLPIDPANSVPPARKTARYTAHDPPSAIYLIMSNHREANIFAMPCDLNQLKGVVCPYVRPFTPSMPGYDQP